VLDFSVILAARKAFPASAVCVLGAILDWNALPFSEIASGINLLLLSASGIHFSESILLTFFYFVMGSCFGNLSIGIAVRITGVWFFCNKTCTFSEMESSDILLLLWASPLLFLFI